MDMTKGADVKTPDEAQAFIRDFILELRNDASGRMRRHSGDYDLYLPWLWEEVINSGTHLEPAHCSSAGGGDYGKGYSVTFAGEDWLTGEPVPAEPALDASPF
jgi:hypothetical protein